MQLSEVLDQLMLNNNASAYKMSKETGLSDSLIGYWRRGEKLPGAENLLTISNYFGISVDFLLTGKEMQPNGEIISDVEQQLINKFRLLDDIDKGKILERMEVMLESCSDVHSGSLKNP